MASNPTTSPTSPTPPRRLIVAAVVMGLMIGVAGGVGGFTILYAEGGSYLTDNPQACANCHIMNEQYEGWGHSSHHGVAVCNDCHTPDKFIPKYITKGLNGYHHSLAFTTGNFDEPIMITERNRRVTEEACRRCHQDVTEAIDYGGGHGKDGRLDCLRCHSSVGHQHLD